MLHVRYASNKVVVLEEDPHHRTIIDTNRKKITLALPYMIYICDILMMATGKHGRRFKPERLRVGCRNAALNTINDLVYQCCIANGGGLNGVCLGEGMPTEYMATPVEAAKSLVRGYYATTFYTPKNTRSNNLVNPEWRFSGDPTTMSYSKWIALTEADADYVPKINTRDFAPTLASICFYGGKLRTRRKVVLTVEKLKNKK